MQDPTIRFLVSTALCDRVGVIRDVTGALAALGGNLTDVRQAIVGGVFLFHAIAEFGADSAPDASAVASAVRAALSERDAGVDVRPCGPAAATARPGELGLEGVSALPGERYVASFSGPDCPGRIHRIATVIAAAGANVEDWRHDLSDPARTLTIGVVALPKGCDPDSLRNALVEELAPLGLAVSLAHENVFRATNEVGPISALLGVSSADAGRNAASAG